MITLYQNGQTEKQQLEGWKDQVIKTDSVERVSVVESGETVSFFINEWVSKEAVAITYLANVHGKRGDIWCTGKTVTNRPGV